MDKHLAKKLNSVLYSGGWSFFEQYLQQELDRAYTKFESALGMKLEEYCFLQAEIRIYKKLLNLKESTRQSLEN